MQKNSKTYQRAVELDKKGYLSQLQEDARKATELDDPARGDLMGAGLSKLAHKAKITYDWIKDEKPNRDLSEEEFEIDTCPSDPELSNPNDEIGESYMDRDPTLDRERNEIQYAIRQMKEICLSRKSEQFTLDPGSLNITNFQEFLTWVSFTSGIKYEASTTSEGNWTVKKEEPRSLLSPSPIPCGSEYPKCQIKSPSESIIESVCTESVQSQYTSKIDAQSQYMTSNSRTILCQLQKGVIVPPKRAGKPKKRVSLKTLGLSPVEVSTIVKDNPSITIQETIKLIYRKKGSWQLFSNMYDLSKIVTDDNPPQ